MIAVAITNWDGDSNTVSSFHILLLRNPSKRHYVLPSSASSEVFRHQNSHLNEGDLYNLTNDAFIIWIIENGWGKWFTNHKLNKFIAAQKEKNSKITDEEMKALVDKEIKDKGYATDLETPYTTATSGRAANLGGVTERGHKRWEEICKLVKKNREENAESIKAVEQKVLVLVREKNNRDEIDAKRAERKKKPASLVPVAKKRDAHFDSEDEDQWF